MRATDGPESGARRLTWLTAEIAEFGDETPTVRSLFLDVPDWPGHRAGQHLDVRLTAEDGYQAQRSYSIASPPEAERLELTIQHLETGEVSTYLTTEARRGDRFQIRGPIGGHFVWTASMPEPLFLIAGGSGIVPLMAMLRHRALAGARAPARLLYSARTFDDIIYRQELGRLAADGSGLDVMHTLTDAQPEGWTGESRRIDRDMLARSGFAASERPRIYICGPTGLVEAAAGYLVELGHAPEMIRTERFGPTGV
jgi:ferredoxin-NADP reductase